jgi:hypothetical protein
MILQESSLNGSNGIISNVLVRSQVMTLCNKLIKLPENNSIVGEKIDWSVVTDQTTVSTSNVNY